jgi:sugar phosphate isomerase/epimerase
VKVRAAGAPHLTYCTNIHAGETWPEVKNVVERHVTRVKDAVAGDSSFGVGLRLSARAAGELSEPEELSSFRSMLAERGLYVFTINGFPYGAFHGTRVKERVYLPDWLDDARLAYTATLGELLATLLPDDVSLGSVSTVPGAFRERVSSADDTEAMGSRILRAAAAFDDIRARTGKTIALALEPEPFCCFETIAETIGFFQEHLFSTRATRWFADLTGMSPSQAEETVRRHVGVCFDACHMAVEFEHPREAFARLSSAGIAVAKVQISAGLEVAFARPSELAPLRAFADDVYLHQVVERGAPELRRYLDLPEALATVDPQPAERIWRIHFHVPVFRQSLGPFSGTQPYLRDVLSFLRTNAVSPHLEVETYTWDVLPEEHRQEGVVDAVIRELNWVKGELEPAS